LNEIEELFPFYALGALSEEEQAQVEAYVAKDISARTRLGEMLTTAQALPFEAAPVPPAGSVKTSLMARVRADAAMMPASESLRPAEALRPAWNSPNWIQILRNWFVSPTFSTLATAAVVLLVVWIVNLQGAVRDLTQQNSELQTSVAKLMETNTILRDQLLADEDLLALLSDPERHEIPIAGTDHQPDAAGTLLVSAVDDKKGILIVGDLSALPEGSVYQFWLIGDGGPVGAGIFLSTAQGQGVLIIHSDQSMLSFNNIGVSIEPAGGSDQPTMQNIVMFGELPEAGGS